MTFWTAFGLVFVACVSASLVGALRLWAERRQLLDVPNERSSHTRPTPRGGGLAIVLVVFGTAAPAFAVTGWKAPWLAWAVAAGCVAAVSWYDDLRGLTYRVRLVVQALAVGSVLVVAPVPVLGVPGVAGQACGIAVLLLAFLWMVGLTNAFNFMDGIDGIAAGQAVVAGGTLAVAGVWTGDVSLAIIAAAVTAACAGFLLHNWSPAKIFMGDVGSAFLGFTFATTAYVASAGEPLVLVVAVFALWPFVFDAAFTFLRRLARGENVFHPHRSHLYQRLVICGWSHALVASLYMGLAAVGSLVGLAILAGVAKMELVGLATVLLLAAVLWATVLAEERGGA